MLRTLVIIGPGLLASLTLLAGMVRAAPLAGKRPNIILVMTDDQGKGDLSCLGNPDLKTPHLDRLHSLSTRFVDFHVSPTCSPTRAALLGGRHEFRSGVTHTINERERMALSTTTIAQVLGDAGYSTAIFGKWHLGDEEPYQPQNRGFDEVFIHGGGGIGQAYPGSCADAPPNDNENGYFDPVIRHNGKFVKTKGFCTDVFFQQALGWIRQQNATGRPMFVMITPNAPHAPMMAPQHCKQPFVDAGFDANTAARYGMIVNIDDNMGRLMRKLADWQMEPSTLVIFMTDNGQAARNAVRNGRKVVLHAAGLRAGKNSVHEGGTRVPAFWRWKGVLEEGHDVSALTAHIDIFPTFVELAGAKIPAGMQKLDGRSMLPLLEQQDGPWADRYLFVHKGRWERGSDPEKFKYLDCAVRNARFRLVNHRQLYDIAADPGETMDVAGQHPEVVKQMQLAYEQWWADTRPLLVNENVPLAPQRPYFVWYEEQLKGEGIGQWQAPEL